jgi:hypothetical protein
MHWFRHAVMLDGTYHHAHRIDGVGRALLEEEPAMKLSGAAFLAYTLSSIALTLTAGLMSGLTIGADS